jgi:predicted transcriptional regulator
MEDMLEVLSKGEEVNKTKIVYGANLNFERASRILNWLMEKGLVKSNSDTYKITEKGEEILGEIDTLATFLK